MGNVIFLLWCFLLLWGHFQTVSGLMSIAVVNLTGREEVEINKHPLTIRVVLSDKTQVIADILTETVRRQFSNEDSFFLVPREKMESVAKAKGIRLKGSTDDSCMAQLGSFLQVDRVVTGAVYKRDTLYWFYLRMIDIEKGGIECSESASGGKGLDSLQRAIPKVVYLLFQSMEHRIRKASEDQYKIGMNFWGREKYKEAERHIREAIRLNPKDVYAYEGLGNLLLEQSQYKEAEEVFNDLIHLEPNWDAGFIGMASSLDKRGRRKEARKFWEQALRVAATIEVEEQIKKRLAESD